MYLGAVASSAIIRMGPKKKVSQRRSEALDSVADLAAATNEDGDDGADEGGLAPDGSKQTAEAALGNEALERDREEVRKLHDRKQALRRTSDILVRHDVVVQKLINKAREDLVWEQVNSLMRQ